MGTILTWLIMGLIVGALARLVVPGSDRMGCIGTSGLGIAGSITGGAIGSYISGNGLAFAPAGLLGSILGAILILLILKKLRD